MQIKGLESMTVEELNRELANGARFVIYQYAISVVILSFKRGSDTPAAGWWGIPFGPIFSLIALFSKPHRRQGCDQGSVRDSQRAAVDEGGIARAITAKPVAIRGSSSFTRFSAFRQLPSTR